MPFSARTKARKRALDLIFAAEARGISAVGLLDAAIAEGDGPTNDYTSTLVRGVAVEQERIDSLIRDHATDWPLERMPSVDRNVLRIAVWELLHGAVPGIDVPAEVAINEAVVLVSELSTDESPSFVNGVLAAIHKSLATV